MRITDVSAVFPTFKTYRKAVTLAETLRLRLAYYTKNQKEKLTYGHIASAQQLITDLETFTARLDRDEIKTHTPWGASILRAPTKAVLAWVFQGLPQPTKAQHDDLTAAIVEQMNEAGRQARAAYQRACCAYEVAYRTHQNWFMIFNTLTVAPGSYYKVFSKKSRAFRDYIRKIDRSIEKVCGNSEPYHTYFAVVEEGAQHGRLHIHVVHFCKKLPAGSQDPNTGKDIPTRRELNTFKTHWPHGFSSPIMVRYAPNDAYGLSGYRWPFDLKTNAPLKVRSQHRLANYLTKYITKSYHSPKREKLLWRIRKTQKLGNALLAELLSTSTPSHLLAIASCTSLNIKLNHQLIPPHLLRQMAIRAYLAHPSSDNHNITLMQRAASLKPLPSLLQYSHASTAATKTSNQQNITALSANAAHSEDTYNKAWAALSSAAHTINNKYFRESTNAYGTTSTKDHLYAAPLTFKQAQQPQNSA